MKPYYSDEWLTVYGGDCLDVMRTMRADSVDCVVTSPPYWGLRDYGSPGQLGLERTPEEYVANMVNVFREVQRVLKPSGTCWLNLGDSYAGSGRGIGDTKTTNKGNPHARDLHDAMVDAGAIGRSWVAPPPGLKPKDLVGIPWRVAFALQADGWYLRSDIIWSKPNPMPESVTDRPTKSHEYLFLLTKQPRYYFDADAVREEYKPDALWRYKYGFNPGTPANDVTKNPAVGRERSEPNPAGRNIRSVWNIATRPYPGAHFAVFPPELPERCIKAGSSEKGVCPKCGAPWERTVSKSRTFESGSGKAGHLPVGKNGAGLQGGGETLDIRRGPVLHVETTGWRPSCRHETLKSQPSVVMDPFAGSGTVGMVANRLSRRAILIDLNPAYLEQQMRRNAQTPLGLSEPVA